MPPRSGFRVARVFGIDVLINPTWLVIFLLVGFSFGDLLSQTTVDGQPFPGGPWPWIVGFITAGILFVGLLAHELSHSLIAKRNGVEINRITLFIFGGVAEMKSDVTSPGVEFRMAVAGPLMTFFLAGAFYGLYRLTDYLGAGALLVAPLYYLAATNLFIGVFNLLPGFPLDGGRVLRALVWQLTGDLQKATRVASIIGQGLALLLAAGGLTIIILYREYLITGGWLILIGTFVYFLAKSSYKQTLLRLAASDTLAKDIMFTDVPVIPSLTPLTELTARYFSTYHLPAFPVAEAGRLVGTVSRSDLMTVNRAEWDVLNAGRAAQPLEPDQLVAPDTPLDQLLRTLLGRREYVLVVDGDNVLGIITRDEVSRYLDARMKTRE
ncbi:MAG: site-2 protease family protein [Actinomycetota bacterium]